jgi:Flp pilus assembly pilin Flp
LTETARPALIRRFFADERGITSVEYGVLACVMALVIVSFAASGMSVGGVFRRIRVLAHALTAPDGDIIEVPIDFGD